MNSKLATGLGLASLLILLALASWLYNQSIVDFEKHGSQLGTFNSLQKLSGQLVGELLVVENAGNNNFDQAANTEVAIEKLLAAPMFKKINLASLVDETQVFLSTANKVKSSHAVFVNSANYYPVSTSNLRKQLLAFKHSQGIAVLNSLEREVILYSALHANATGVDVEGMDKKIAILDKMSGDFNQDLKNLVEVQRVHAKVLMTYSDKLYNFNQQLLNNKVAELSSHAIKELNDDFTAQVLISKNIKTGFYVTVFVLLYLSFIFWQKQRSVLKQFQEHSDKLDFSMSMAKQKPFDIDVLSEIITLGKKPKEIKLSINEWIQNIHPEDRDTVVDMYSKVLADGNKLDAEYRWKSQEDCWIWVCTLGRVVEQAADGKPLRIMGLSTDVTDRRADERVLRVMAEGNKRNVEDHDVFHTIVKELAIAKGIQFVFVAKINPNNRMLLDTLAVWGGDDFVENFSYPIENTPCKNILSGEMFFYPDNIQDHFPDNDFLVGMGMASYFGVPLKNSQNKVIGLLSMVDSQPMKDRSSSERLMMSLAARAAIEMERVEATQELTQLAHYDALTGLPNRSLLSDRFLQAQAHSERTDSLLAVCFLDLDDFKPVNDNYGHDVGDLLLKEVAKRLLDSIRRDDTVARLGGDEFVLLIGEVATAEECELSLDRVIHALSQPYEIEGESLRISASIGYSLTIAAMGDLDTLIKEADQAMYEAKKKGNNTYSAFNSELDQQATERHSKLSEIQQALRHEQFQLFYQPKINMRTGKVYGAEALIRWIHPDKGMIPPLDFLPYIDATHTEVDVGKWAINEALRQMDVWQKAGVDLEVSVNISSFHLMDGGFVMNLQHSLEQHSAIKPSSFQLEILESSVLGDIDSISGTLQECRDTLGVKLALDDFGTGYSSFTHLRRLPADTVKIDRTFVRDILSDENDYAIVKAVVGLADSFKLDVIAEGVETDEQGKVLIELGCDCGQGFGIAKPMPADELAQWLKEYQPNQAWLLDKK